MKLIRPGAGHYVDDGSARETHFGREIGLLDFEFFDRINRRSVRHAVKTAVLFEIRRARPIDQNVGGGVPAAIGIEVDWCSRSWPTGTRCIGFNDTGRQEREIGELATVQRQIIHESPVYDLAGGRILGLQLDTAGLHLDGLRGRTHS